MASRLPRGGRKATTTPTAPPREAKIGDNGGEEYERIQLISIVNQLDQANSAIEVAKAPYDAAKKARSRIIGAGKAAGFSAKELERRLEEMKGTTRENAELAARERRHRRWLGIIDADQEKLQLGNQTPQSAKDEAHWEAEGYKAGLRFHKPVAPPGITGLDLQAWLRGHENGWESATEATAANAPKALTVREQAAKDFKDDNPEAPEPGSPEAKKAERDAIAKAKASLEAMNGGDASVEGADGQDALPSASGTAGPDDGFEMTAEELAAQAGRRKPEEETEDVV